MMKISKSKFVKSAISILLVVMMLLSAGMSSIIAATVDMVSTGADISEGTVLYLYPSHSDWRKNNERYAAYFIGNNSDVWASMTKVSETDYYSVTAPSGTWKNVIFCRMNGSTTENKWDNRWNQTEDLTYDGTKNLFTVTGKNGDKYTGTWSTYPPTPSSAEGQYLTIYSYSDSDYDKLTLTESNGTNTNTVLNAVTQPSEKVFGSLTWKSSGQLQLTNGYSNSVTASLSGAAAASGNRIYVDFSAAGANWGSGHFLSITSLSNKDKTTRIMN